jgi:filamentous hemagglutinin family protein
MSKCNLQVVTITAAFSMIGFSFPISSFAQTAIAPDNTLPVNTLVNFNSANKTYTITGGTQVGTNQFHSFQDFSVPTGNTAHFDTAPTIVNAIGRVTGSNVSNIDGILRTNGATNLYLVNPNGIIFGANAKLDIAGSFSASTANSIKFSDGSEFSATNPQAPPLLNVTIPLGLQYGKSNAGATIVNQGNLVAGQDLVLNADKLDLQGTLQAGRDLTLQAQDLVKIRDTVANPFVANSGRDLTIQGNSSVDIFVLNNPLTQILSGRHLSLVSDGEISGDAHFLSGGNLSFLTTVGGVANFISKYDPIIRANGNVTFGNYTGAALKVEAMGSIQAGNIRITDPDCQAGTVGCAGGIPITDPDFVTLTTLPSVILRSGVTSLGAPAASITLGSIDTSSSKGDGGSIELTAKGDIKGSGFFLYSHSSSGNGGAISLSTINGDISLDSLDLNSFSEFGSAGNGGAISLSTINGDISLTKIRVDSASYSNFGNAGNGGAISLSTVNGNISLDSWRMYSYSNLGNVINSGAISLSTINGDISLNSSNFDSRSFSNSGNAGNGGAISLSTINGDISLNSSKLYSYTLVSSGNAGNGGDIVLSAIKGNILGAGSSSIYSFSVANSPNSTSGDGGNITLEAKNLINNIELVTFSSSGNAGKATINGFEDLTISRLQISTSKTVSIPNPVSDRGRPITFDFGTSGSSGDVTVTGLGSLTFDNTIINSTTQSINPAGNISITSPSLINFQNNSQIKSSTNSTGNAGNISFTAPILNITGGSQVLAETNGDGAGGNIDINASNIINLKRILDSSPVLSVQTSNGGKAGTIVINTPTLNLSDQARITATATATSTNTDGGGSVTLNASTMNLSGTVGVFAETESSANAGTLKLNPYLNDPNLLVTLTTGSQISASTSAQGNGGDLILKAPNSITLSGQGTLAVEAKQGSTGNAGNISFTTGNLLLTDGVTVSASTAGSGKAGDISVKVNDFTISNGASIETKTSSSGDSGKIEVIVGNNLILVGAGTGFFADTTAESTGKGGSIFIDPPLVSITNGAGISVNSLGKGNGGNIDIFADKFIFDNNAFLRANTASGEGGNINLQIANIFFPRNNSSITATAAGTGNGGNITLSALFLVSLPSENNDIFANAFLGKGGNINITTQGIFGLAFRPRLTPLSDITASSDFGVQGNVNLNTPGVDPSQGLNNLPADINDASKLVSQKCLADRQGSSFVITGRGGVPASPFDTISAANIPDHLGSISNQTARSTSNRITAESSNLPVPDRIVEAQGWTINAQGQVSLIATAIATPAQVWSHQTNCISASK